MNNGIITRVRATKFLGVIIDEKLTWKDHISLVRSKLAKTVGILYLTRFNKIATQGAPQMAVDKEANSLSRVYSYYPKFNLRLFYV